MKNRLLNLIEHFLVFEDDGSSKLVKIMAGYHQFHAVNIAIEETLRAAKLKAFDPALGFEGSEVTGKTGDGGVDATGELNVSNLAKVKIFVQAKRRSRFADQDTPPEL